MECILIGIVTSGESVVGIASDPNEIIGLVVC